TWRFYCVRGPLTAKACGLSESKVAGDAAILLNVHRPRRAAVVRHRCSFMPHWQSIDRGNWRAACELADLDFIDPRDPVEEIIDRIEASAVLITEAMHGAIVADALRVPWIPILPFGAGHRMKWLDWAGALDVRLNPVAIWPSSLIEALILATKRPGDRL